MYMKEVTDMEINFPITIEAILSFAGGVIIAFIVGL